MLVLRNFTNVLSEKASLMVNVCEIQHNGSSLTAPNAMSFFFRHVWSKYRQIYTLERLKCRDTKITYFWYITFYIPVQFVCIKMIYIYCKSILISRQLIFAISESIPFSRQLNFANPNIHHRKGCWSLN